ncbi:hypothetical protein ABZ532_12665 [Streptomyces sp. NPDC019396]|uniref:hypothetical protein n=1 Tax=Streptomyces sp. NPDC019396 TaxID=3154687 RepID=UPI0033DECAC9
MIRLVWRELRGKLWSHPGWWFVCFAVTAVLAAVAFAVGALAAWGGMDIGETWGDSYDPGFALQHPNDPLFPLHNWCNSEHDLVPSWVNPTVGGLAAVSVVCLVMTVAIGVARVMGKKKQRNQRG